MHLVGTLLTLTADAAVQPITIGAQIPSFPRLIQARMTSSSTISTTVCHYG